VYKEFLVVSGGRQPRVHARSTVDIGDRNEVALGRVWAPSGDAVDLGGGVGRHYLTARRVAARSAADDNHVLLAVRPLALRSYQPCAEFENQVVSQALVHRLEHGDAEFDRRRGDPGLRYRSLLIGRQHKRTLVRAADGKCCTSQPR
jgi:hypothetical protein